MAEAAARAGAAGEILRGGARPAWERALAGRTLLVPSMHPAGAEFLAAGFRAIGVPAHRAGDGRRARPGARADLRQGSASRCQVTLGDVLLHLQAERERLGPAFDARSYAYFLPEADRSLPLRDVQQVPAARARSDRGVSRAADRRDHYGGLVLRGGLVPAADATRFRLMTFMTMLVADALDRIALPVPPVRDARGRRRRAARGGRRADGRRRRERRPAHRFSRFPRRRRATRRARRAA